jgi:hypothetical protein
MPTDFPPEIVALFDTLAQRPPSHDIYVVGRFLPLAIRAFVGAVQRQRKATDILAIRRLPKLGIPSEIPHQNYLVKTTCHVAELPSEETTSSLHLYYSPYALAAHPSRENGNYDKGLKINESFDHSLR